ncbi:hypothetical protein HPB52_017052 [Rhipicephalus sanguineus]|uniref:BRCT domain-containing protein n=1 Tax=Rhipicephalus sanguineus TaxID=34632 RepID=A0A9D4SV67_RHISA|nr:hypothetical protein HPB52_017052 [Rhipicephalus sanguineus]
MTYVQDDKRGSSAVVPRRQSEKEEGDSDFDADTDVDANDEDYDTEEEIQKVMQRQQKQETEASKHVGSDADPFVGDASGLDDASAIPLDLPDLPAFFTGKTFLLYGDFPADERRALTRYIVGHDGDLKEDLDDTVKFVITKSEWNDNFDETGGEKYVLRVIGAVLASGNIPRRRCPWQAAESVRRNIRLAVLELDGVGVVAQVEGPPLDPGCRCGWNWLTWVENAG